MSMLNIMCVVLETPYGGTCYADLTGGVPLPKGYAMIPYQGSTLRVVRSSNPTWFVLRTSWVDNLVVQFWISIYNEISVSA